VPDGTRQRLTAGELTTNLNSISPDGKTLLFSRSLIDYSERPFSKTELYSLDLETLKAQLLWKGKWFNSAQWAPDGKKLLVLGGPEVFGKMGVNVSKGVIPNAYDVQAYLFDPVTKNAESLTRDFNPTINQAFWSKTEDCIYFITTDRSYVRLYRYNLEKKEFSLIASAVEVIHRFDMAKNKPLAVYTGSSAVVPPRAYVLDLQNKKVRLFKDSGEEDFAEVQFGKVERWTFKNKKGERIEGRIYYPPNFNPSRKYPCIVYYYGGTSPVTRDFGGRYPKNLYAAQGYVVYVLQPSGAVGFGQKFSALHVNDWGIIVADEIILGVKKFLKAHPFVDPNRVGCMGASYGGFMTMLLQTRTNMFAAAVAHAGISSISSYWGEGYWGYVYSSIATANSYPWNRKDIYVNQSALFNADKITTPLLLLHGSVDTNVPPGESTQLFAALKLLGKEVEYIQILDQNHHIMTYNKRIIWTKTIMAWFDRWLKRQPEWWVDLYPIK
jgi:dipeptidyl aminopeptidase/acylaminoacyl peptidase